MIPARFAPILFGLILTCLMTFIVSGISTWRNIGLTPDFASAWMAAWFPSWAIAFPVVLFVGPMTRKIVARLTQAAPKAP